MQFKAGAAVVTADNKDVGTLDRVVLDPRNREVTHLVVRQGFLFTEDKVLPVDLVSKSSEDRVVLAVNADELPELPAFEETHYVAVDEEGTPAGYAQPLYWYPPVGVAHWGFPYPAYAPYPISPAYTETPYVAETEQNIPEGTVALQEGAHVFSADGEHVGDVERVLVDPETDRATHFLISQGLLLKNRKLVPLSWTSTIGEDEVYLLVGTRLLDRLGEYKD